MSINSVINKWLMATVVLISFVNVAKAEMDFDDIAVHGFVSQGVMRAAKSNLVNDEGDTSFKLTDIGINAIWQINPKLTLSGQATYLNADNRFEEGARVDYLFLKWTVISNPQWTVDLFAGRYKNNHWLYSSTNDVPFTRPTIMLPQSVYFAGTRDIGLGSDGAGLQVTHNSNIGEFEFNWSYGDSDISKEQVQAFISDNAQGDGEQEFAHQASLFWRPQLSKFQWGISFLDSSFNYFSSDEEPLFDATLDTKRYFVNLVYNEENWEFASEAFLSKSKTIGLLSPSLSSTKYSQGWYFQFRYFITDKTILTLRKDSFYADKDDRSGNQLEQQTYGLIPNYFGFQHDKTLGVSYDLAKNWQLKAEYHWIEGGARTLPITFPDTEINNSKYWDFWALQIITWF